MRAGEIICRSLIVASILVVALLNVSCGNKNKLVGYYELASSQDQDWTLQLIILPENQYVMTEIEYGTLQNELRGEYKLLNGNMILKAFVDGKDAEFSYTFVNELLTLKLLSLGGETESLPDYDWTFRRK